MTQSSPLEPPSLGVDNGVDRGHVWIKYCAYISIETLSVKGTLQHCARTRCGCLTPFCPCVEFRWYYIVVVPDPLVTRRRWENPEDIDIHEVGQ